MSCTVTLISADGLQKSFPRVDGKFPGHTFVSPLLGRLFVATSKLPTLNDYEPKTRTYFFEEELRVGPDVEWIYREVSE